MSPLRSLADLFRKALWTCRSYEAVMACRKLFLAKWLWLLPARKCGAKNSFKDIDAGKEVRDNSGRFGTKWDTFPKRIAHAPSPSSSASVPRRVSPCHRWKREDHDPGRLALRRGSLLFSHPEQQRSMSQSHATRGNRTDSRPGRDVVRPASPRSVAWARLGHTPMQTRQGRSIGLTAGILPKAQSFR